MKRSIAVALAIVFSGCRKPSEPRTEAIVPAIETSTASQWKIERSTPDVAVHRGDFFVYVELDTHEGIVGVALGDVRGPTSGLLGGSFAPLVAPPSTSRAPRVSIDLRGGELVARFGEGPELSEVAVAPPANGRVRLFLRGAPLLLLPADRTEVRTMLAGAPIAALAVTAGEAVRARTLHADRIEILTRKLGTVVVETSCPHPKIVEPIPRGSTSVFVLAPGLGPSETDPLFGAGPPAENVADPCPRATTSTVSLPWPPP